MKYSVFILLFSVILLIGDSILAQVDPSSSLLLQSGRRRRSSSGSSDRYTIKQPPQRDSASPVETPRLGTERNAAPPQKVPPVKTQTLSPSRDQKGSDTVVKSLVTVTPAKTGETKPGDDKHLGEQVQELFMGGSTEAIEDYRKLLHPSDIRQNLMEVSIAPVYIYNDSSSEFWHRNYFTDGPGASVAVKVWITPFFGLQSSFLTSLSTSMRGNLSGSSSIPVDHQFFDVGFRFRKFFGLSRKASYLSLGLDFDEYQLKVPAKDPNRLGIRTL